MKKIKVTDLKAGMMFDQPVYIDPTNVLVQAKQEILARDIDRLVKWGILEVETNGKLVGNPAPTDNATAEKPAAAPAPAAPATAAGGVSVIANQDDPEIAAISSDYETLRKYKRNFRNETICKVAT